MRALTINELMRLPRIELCNLLTQMTNALAGELRQPRLYLCRASGVARCELLTTISERTEAASAARKAGGLPISRIPGPVPSLPRRPAKPRCRGRPGEDSPIIRELRASGMACLRGTADELNIAIRCARQHTLARGCAPVPGLGSQPADRLGPSLPPSDSRAVSY
jgi:hypothetical protein